MSVFTTPRIEGTKKVQCPECYALCGWCSWYRMNARVAGCGVGGRKKCEDGEAERGKTCSTCDGSGYVMVRMEIVKPIGGGAQ